MTGVDNKCPLVLVEWEDSAQPVPAWTYLADFEAPSIVKCVSVGWLIHDGKDVKALAPNMGESDNASALQASGIIRITTDGHRAYLDAVEGAFGANVDYAQLVKLYGADPEQEKRYSPAKCIGARKDSITGKPDKAHVSTSYVERQNLTMRMHMRRFTRLTNAFSKKVENHALAVALHFTYYNFVRIHKTLKCTPAMAAGVTTRLWELEDIVKLMDEAAPKPGPRGSYKKSADQISN